MQPTHALVFAADISKTATGIAVLKMPFLDTASEDNLGRPNIVFAKTIKPKEVAQGAARVWWPTAVSIYAELHHIIGSYRRMYPDCLPIFVYEGAAWGANTSEMMVWLQQRLFEWLDSDPITNLDLIGVTPGGARAFARGYSGTPHDPEPKRLARAIFDDLIARELIVNLSSLAAAQKFDQDSKDAVVIGTAACLSTIQFLKVRQIEGLTEWSPHYSESVKLFDQWTEKLKADPKLREYRKTSPTNLRQMMKDLSKRDEPHLSTQNPYLYPARTFRLLHRDAEEPIGFGVAGHQFVYSKGLTKAGDKQNITIVHGHPKSV